MYKIYLGDREMCAYKILYVWVEGVDDKRFFEKVLIPKFRVQYEDIRIIEYAKMRKEKIDNYIKSIESIGADYIFLADIDNFPCVTRRKEKIKSEYKNILGNKIIIVVKEIESWYLAGLNDRVCRQMRIKNCTQTDSITKEAFNNLIPKKFTSRLNFMLEVLTRFSIDAAKQKNKSFKYFMGKYGY